MHKARGTALGCSALTLLIACVFAAAHTLPISYLQMMADAEYLHVELIFNPFELTFVSEVDGDKNGELDQQELKRNGEMVARRVADALKITVGGKPMTYESAGMDPDLSGHHVRMRVHYKVDARQKAVSIESDLNTITSSSHLVQARYINGEYQQLAQLDSRSKKATFHPPNSGGSNTAATTTPGSHSLNPPQTNQARIQ